MYLADSNIFLEILLEQDRADEAQLFLDSINLSDIFMTDLALHSIGINLFREGKCADFNSFVENIVSNGVNVVSLDLEDLKTLNQLSQKFNLDFDDAYQYAVAAKLDLELISFDKDFDRTERKRKEPAEVLG